MYQYRRLFQLIHPHRLRMALATSLIVVGTLLNLAVPANVSRLVDSLFTDTSGSTLDSVALILGGLLVGRMVMSVAASYILEWTGERIMADLRRRLFAHLLSLDMRFYSETRLGEITSRATNDVTLIQHALTTTITNFVDRALLAVGTLTLMTLLNWRLTLATLTSVPLVTVVARVVGRYQYRLSRIVQDRLAAATGVMEESLGAIRVVKIFTREPYEQGRYDREIETMFRAARTRARLTALYSPVVTTLFMSALVLVLWLGAREVLAGRLTPGKMLEFLLYGSYLSTSVATFAGTYSTFKRAIGATERLFELLDEPREIVAPPDAAWPLPMRGALRFDRVSFGYSPDQPVLADLSFEISPGEVVALVGVSGVGKSTLMDLIPRYYDVSSGRVLVDGQDIRSVALEGLRAGIASVPQDTILFAATVRENLRYGRIEASDDELVTAARAANAHEFIQALPHGYDTLVGERGVKLSGGQRQRVAIARALLKQPSILLLDEATSSLDSEAERAVQQALDELLAEHNRTTLVIAHRLSTVRNADRILVLAPVQGVARLVEQGTHEELLARRGVYYDLYTLQFRDTLAAAS